MRISDMPSVGIDARAGAVGVRRWSATMFPGPHTAPDLPPLPHAADGHPLGT